MKNRATACLLALSVLLPLPAFARTTIVSLAFDDALASQYAAAQLLEARGLRASFFVTTGRIGDEAGTYLDWRHLERLAAAGHEIGGHTVSHADLSRLDLDAQLREICDDRFALLSRGFAPRTLAYPFNRTNEHTEAAAIACGYNAARATSGLGCATCPRAESIPPENPYFLRAVESVDHATTLEDLQGAVRAAEDEGGAWVPVVFHHVCGDCGEELAVAPDVLDAFAAWLVERGTPVRTIGDVIGGTLQPGREGPPEEPLQRPAGNLLANGSLEDDADGDGMPDCWKAGSVGNNDGAVSRVPEAHEGQWGVRVEIADHQDGDRKLISAQDRGACAPRVEAGTKYALRAHYRADAEVRPIAYVRGEAGGWRWWTQGPALAPAAAWTEAAWTLPELPDDATHVSVGLSLRGEGFLAVDALELRDPDADADAERPPRQGGREGGSCASTFVGLAGLSPLLRRRR